MPVRAAVTGIILIFMTAMLVSMVEYFLPLSKKAELDMICRSALLEMESAGGMNSERKGELKKELEEKGLTDVAVTATEQAKQQDMLSLSVEGDYSYSRLTSIFNRENVRLHMVYRKSSMSRRVIN
jgi:hypothetical protein